MPGDNTPAQIYRDTGIPRYFMTPSIVDNFCKNSTVQCSRRFSFHNCVSISRKRYKTKTQCDVWFSVLYKYYYLLTYLLTWLQCM